MVAVTDEARPLVDAYVAKNKPLYPVVIESVDSGETFGIVQGYPTQYVIDAAGKIAWAGNFFDQDPQCEALLERLLLDARVPPELPARFAAERKLIQADKFGEAAAALSKAAADESVDAADREGAAKVVQWLEEKGATALSGAQKDEEAGNVAEAAAAYGTITTQFAGMEPAAEAAAALKALLADPKKKREVDAAKALAKVKEKTASLDPKKALPQYRLVAANWKNTKAAEEAARIAKELEAKLGK